MKKFFLFLVFVILVLGTNSVFAQVVKFGPRLSGNFNIYNEKGSTLSRNGLGIDRTVDVSFTQHIGLMLDLTVFDMKNFSASVTNANVIQEDSRSLSYISLDPMFKTDFSGFYMVGVLL
jgi:hypothetical protein